MRHPQREEMITLFKSGIKNKAEISRRLGVRRSTVNTTIKRYLERGDLKDRPGRGPKHKQDPKQLEEKIKARKVPRWMAASFP
jgi:transposase